jgi:hypothetical protein
VDPASTIELESESPMPRPCTVKLVHRLAGMFICDTPLTIAESPEYTFVLLPI